MRSSIIFTGIIITVFFIGCGSAADRPSEVVDNYHQAIMDKDLETVMSLSVPEESSDQVEVMLEFRSDGMKRAGGIPVIVNEEIDGDNAVVRCKFGPVEQDVNLRKVDGKWKVE